MTYRVKKPRTVEIRQYGMFLCHVHDVDTLEETDTPCLFLHHGDCGVAGFNAKGLTHDFPRVDELADQPTDAMEVPE